MNNESLSVLIFNKTDLTFGLIIAVLTTPATYYFFRKAVVDPCEGEFVLLNIFLWILFFLVTFWAVIGITRFARNEQRRFGQFGNFNRWGHLLFLLPSLALPAMMIVYTGLVFVGFIFLLSLVVIFMFPRQRRIGYLYLIGGNAVLGGVVWVVGVYIQLAALICWF